MSAVITTLKDAHVFHEVGHASWYWFAGIQYLQIDHDGNLVTIQGYFPDDSVDGSICQFLLPACLGGAFGELAAKDRKLAMPQLWYRYGLNIFNLPQLRHVSNKDREIAQILYMSTNFSDTTKTLATFNNRFIRLVRSFKDERLERARRILNKPQIIESRDLFAGY
jgi:hypothetical protein